MQNLGYDWKTAFSGESVTITRKRDGVSVHLQGEEAARFDREEERISDRANGAGEPYYVRAMDSLCGGFFNA